MLRIDEKNVHFGGHNLFTPGSGHCRHEIRRLLFRTRTVPTTTSVHKGLGLRASRPGVEGPQQFSWLHFLECFDCLIGFRVLCRIGKKPGSNVCFVAYQPARGRLGRDDRKYNGGDGRDKLVCSSPNPNYHCKSLEPGNKRPPERISAVTNVHVLNSVTAH